MQIFVFAFRSVLCQEYAEKDPGVDGLGEAKKAGHGLRLHAHQAVGTNFGLGEGGGAPRPPSILKGAQVITAETLSKKKNVVSLVLVNFCPTLALFSGF